MSEDPDFQPIIQSEDYRRAKRNTLFWSAITALLALGHPGSKDGGLGVELFQTGLVYDYPVVVAICWVVALYMAIGYLRSERNLKFRNSKLLFGKRAGEVVDAFQTLAQDARSASDFARQIEQQLNVHLASAEREKHLLPAQPVAQILDMAINDLRNQSATRDLSRDFARANPLEEAQRVIGVILSNATGALERAKNPMEQVMASYRKVVGMVDTAVVNAADHSIELDRRLEALTESANQLRMFHQAIDKTDLRFFRWHDRLPVWGLFALATLVMLAAAPRLPDSAERVSRALLPLASSPVPTPATRSTADKRSPMVHAPSPSGSLTPSPTPAPPTAAPPQAE